MYPDEKSMNDAKEQFDSWIEAAFDEDCFDAVAVGDVDDSKPYKIIGGPGTEEVIEWKQLTNEEFITEVAGIVLGWSHHC